MSNKLICICLFLSCILSLAGNAFAGRHSAAEIFNGALYFVNGTGPGGVATKDPANGPFLGNLIYAPAYPGALFGNMSVCFGNQQTANSTEEQVLSLISAYTGPYQVFPDANPPYVIHYPIITNNPINGHTAQGVPALRYYESFEDDNLVNVLSLVPTVSGLFWRRNFPFPPAPACTLAASLTAAGSAWVSNGESFQQYTLAVSNVGEVTITSAQVTINLAPGQTIQSSWNIQLISDTTYSVALYSGLAVGASSNSAGLIIGGTGSLTVAVPTTGTVCN